MGIKRMCAKRQLLIFVVTLLLLPVIGRHLGKAVQEFPAEAAGEDIFLARQDSDFLRKQGLVFVEGGCFEMGDIFGVGRDDEKPVHEVCVDDFYMAKYEVTVGEFKAFVADTGYKNRC
ncbi:MAG: formylglycine-generating enzyme family protein [Nitrospiria bacterium]